MKLWATGERGSGILGVHNIGLHLVLDFISRVSAGHDALVKSALSPVAVITTNTKDDGAFLLHGVIATVRARAIVKG